jgi:phage terminase small subunit
MNDPKLTQRQERFVAHYAATSNATQSAKDAGYSAHSATVAGYDTLRNPQVARAVFEKQADYLAEAGVTANDIVTGLLLEANDRSSDRTANARVQAWKVLAQMAGLVETKVSVRGQVDHRLEREPLGPLSLDQLDQIIDAGHTARRVLDALEAGEILELPSG